MAVDPVSRAQNTSITPIEPQRVIGRPWPKGVSGNPGGRPKKGPGTRMFEELMENPEVFEAVKQNTIKTLTSRGMAGVLLLREILERLEGKVTQGLELSGGVNVMSDADLDERLAKFLGIQPVQPDESRRDTITVK
jgi:hypothetical protein